MQKSGRNISKADSSHAELERMHMEETWRDGLQTK